MKKEKLRIHHLEKLNNYGKVLDDISLTLYEGESLGLLGLNDNAILALLDIVSGGSLPDAGIIEMDEAQMAASCYDTKREIAYIRRKSSLITNLSITENIFVIRRHRHLPFYVREKLFERQVISHFADLGINIDISRPVSELSEGEKCIVEIAKAYILGASLILIDTSATHFSETDDTLERLITCLKHKNITFLVADTRWASLERYCDRIALFRNASAWKTVNADPEGKSVMEKVLFKSAEDARLHVNLSAEESQVVLSANCVYTALNKPFSFNLHAGEILCIHDYNKASLLALAEQLKPPQCLPMLSESFQRIAQNKIIATDFNPVHFFIDSLSIQDNLCIPIYPRISSAGIIHKDRVAFILDEFLKKTMGSVINGRTRCASLNEVEKLKLYLYRVKIQNPVYLLYVDVETTMNYGMRSIIHKSLSEYAEQGTAILILTMFIEDYEHISTPVTVLSAQ